MSDQIFTKDGYLIIEPNPTSKGICCGLCGMKFDSDKAYAYCCQHPRCPVQMNPSCRA